MSAQVAVVGAGVVVDAGLLLLPHLPPLLSMVLSDNFNMYPFTGWVRVGRPRARAPSSRPPWVYKFFLLYLFNALLVTWVAKSSECGGGTTHCNGRDAMRSGGADSHR